MIHDMRWRRAPDLTIVIAVAAFLLMLGPSKSLAGVNRWTTNGPDGGYVAALAIDPSQSATLYAGTQSGCLGAPAIFKSQNSGGNWEAISEGLTTDIVQVQALAIDPATGAVYAGTLGGGVFRSANGVQSWTAFNTSLTATNVKALTIDTSALPTVCAGTAGGGVFEYEIVTVCERCPRTAPFS